jgi:hypothetical protein
MNIDEKLISGPGFGWTGYSAQVGDGTFYTIPANSKLDLIEYGISFWVFLFNNELEGIFEYFSKTPDPLQTSGLRWCPLLYKGTETQSDDKTIVHRNPAIFLDREKRHLKVYFTTTADGESTPGEVLTSNSAIPYNKWTQISVNRETSLASLWINGILDRQINTAGTSVPNSDPLYIGNEPQYESQCDIPALVDNLKYFNRPLTVSEIQAESSTAVYNANPSALMLGCINCPIRTAKNACLLGYHLCTSMEIHSFAFETAKDLGWVRFIKFV